MTNLEGDKGREQLNHTFEDVEVHVRDGEAGVVACATVLFDQIQHFIQALKEKSCATDADHPGVHSFRLQHEAERSMRPETPVSIKMQVQAAPEGGSGVNFFFQI